MFLYLKFCFDLKLVWLKEYFDPKSILNHIPFNQILFSLKIKFKPKNKFGPKILLDPYFFWTQHFLESNIFWTQMFWTQIILVSNHFFDPTFFWAQYFFGPTYFLLKFLDLTFQPNFFYTQKIAQLKFQC